jgi:hypothetical protein
VLTLPQHGLVEQVRLAFAFGVPAGSLPLSVRRAGERSEQLRLHGLQLTRYPIDRLFAAVKTTVLARFGLVQNDKSPLVALLERAEHGRALTND